ncbi:hypothetical protein KP509_16G073100 [Ceratopteris richardii]|uniref:Uncharacterized protein n=1 Tax=Ceratopteris richardii TaxID=49495 RepID=A0A8T2T1H9_CERRI|nr:hypothetical protein KP509_16G073100 [Ceratopteris richardii]
MTTNPYSQYLLSQTEPRAIEVAALSLSIITLPILRSTQVHMICNLQINENQRHVRNHAQQNYMFQTGCLLTRQHKQASLVIICYPVIALPNAKLHNQTSFLQTIPTCKTYVNTPKAYIHSHNHKLQTACQLT